MIHPIATIRLAATALGAACFWLTPSVVKADQRIVCPSSAKPLTSAAPILGPLQQPWGELQEAESTKSKDGSYVIRYDLTGGDAPQLEKWLICRYQDASYKAIQLSAATRECRIRTKEDGPANPTINRHHYRVLDVSCR